MAISTTQSIWRSGGGDQTRTAYCGSGVMAAKFYFSATQTSGNALNQSGGQAVILPAGAVITEIQVNGAATGGTDPTFDMGFTLYTTGTASPAGLINEGDANAGKQVLNWSSAGNVGLGVAMSASEMVYITGRKGASAPTGGSISGTILYFVTDPLAGQQNV